jgi:hypothetical protein
MRMTEKASNGDEGEGNEYEREGSENEGGNEDEKKTMK